MGRRWDGRTVGVQTDGNNRNKRRLARVKSDVSIVTLLCDLGYYVRPDGGDREQQFSCDLHGDGLDSKPSARVYPESNSWYCFGCGVTRDVVQTIRDKKDLGFLDAISYLERQYQLPPLPWEDETLEEESDDSSSREFDVEKHRFQVFMDTVTTEKSLPMGSVLAYWEAFDKLVYGVDKEVVNTKLATQVLVKLRRQVAEAVMEEHSLGEIHDIKSRMGRCVSRTSSPQKR